MGPISEEDLRQPAILSACGNLHQFFQQWVSAGAAVPFSFEQLSQHSAAGSEAKELVLRLLGEQRDLWFRDEAAQDKDLLPRQAVIAVYGILETAKSKYEGLEQAKAAATTCLAALTDQHKKRRLSAVAH